VVAPDRDAGREPGDLPFPVGEQGRRAHHERGTRRPVQVERDDRERLPQAHVVGEDRAETEPGDAGQPRHGSPLVVAQRGLQPGYGDRLVRLAGVRPARAGEEPSEASRGRAVEGVRADLDLPGEGGADGLGPGDGGQDRVAGSTAGCRVDDHPLAAHPDESLRPGDGGAGDQAQSAEAWLAGYGG
jgi:hypothetical protein